MPSSLKAFIKFKWTKEWSDILEHTNNLWNKTTLGKKMFIYKYNNSKITECNSFIYLFHVLGNTILKNSEQNKKLQNKNKNGHNSEIPINCLWALLNL